MNLAKVALDNKVTTLVLTAGVLVGGLVSYRGMGRLEDPVFTIKDALVFTPYAGATAEEVRLEVTDRLEQAVQTLGQLDLVEGRSERSLSTIKVTIKSRYGAATLPQVWDELRRKVGDAQTSLPPGAGPSIVLDDFGDVFGMLVAVYGDGYSYRELEDYADFLRRELLLVQDVAKIDTFGTRDEAIYVELNRDRMSQLGIQPERIFAELSSKNLVTNAGRVEVAGDYLALRPTGEFTSEQQFGSLLISGTGDQQIYLRDVADIRRSYVEPPGRLLRFDGKPAIALAISTIPDGNVVTMGDALEVRMRELEEFRPVGIELGPISLQNQSVVTAIDSFIANLLGAVVIVVVVLLLFMGLRSGLLIGFILFLTICGTFILMSAQGVTLERISLGALIIALGMLVDNAIVVVDGMLVGMQGGKKPEDAAIDVVGRQSMPLLGATVIAILAFAAIGTSQDKTGEYCRSLFQVIWMSLGLSWVTAVTSTPVIGAMVLKVKPLGSGDEERDPYGGLFYGGYRTLLSTAIRYRMVTMVVIVGLFAGAIGGFGNVTNSFFPDSTRPQFMFDFWAPTGTHIFETETAMAEIEEWILEQPNVTHVSTFIGGGAPRFLLTYSPQRGDSAYGQFLVDVDDFTQIDRLKDDLEQHVGDNYPQAMSNGFKFMVGPGEPGKIRARLMGPDPAVLRELGEQVTAIFRADPNTKAIRNDWGDRVKVVRPVLAEEQANLNGITRPDVAQTVMQGFEGVRTGVYREDDDLIPIIVRAPEQQRSDIANAGNLQIWSPAVQQMIPLRQVISGFETVWDDQIQYTQDRRPTLTVFADPIEGPAAEIFPRIRAAVESQVELPLGFSLEWWGEYRDSGIAQASLAGSLPLFIALMVLVVIALFNNIRQALVIWLTVPLAIIGVTVGLLVTDQPFSFMALLGVLSLIGMLIKNAIVLIDQINLEMDSGKDPFLAVVDSGTSRLRAVGLAAATTILGMMPLFQDVFFVSMAVTIAFGLGFATLLTMVVVPVLYSIFFQVRAAGPPPTTDGADIDAGREESPQAA